MIEILASALFFRLRGIIGWPGTLLFGFVQAYTLSDFGWYALLAVVFVMAWEPTGWKPKDWDLPAWTQWEPNIKALQNPRPFYRPAWLSSWLIPAWTDDNPKYFLDWRGAWIEIYFGGLVGFLVLLISHA